MATQNPIRTLEGTFTSDVTHSPRNEEDKFPAEKWYAGVEFEDRTIGKPDKPGFAWVNVKATTPENDRKAFISKKKGDTCLFGEYSYQGTPYFKLMSAPEGYEMVKQGEQPKQTMPQNTGPAENGTEIKMNRMAYAHARAFRLLVRQLADQGIKVDPVENFDALQRMSTSIFIGLGRETATIEQFNLPPKATE